MNQPYQRSGFDDALTTFSNLVGIIVAFMWVLTVNDFLFHFVYDNFAIVLWNTASRDLIYWVWLFFLFVAIVSVVKFAIYLVFGLIKSIFAVLLALLFRRKEPR